MQPLMMIDHNFELDLGSEVIVHLMRRILFIGISSRYRDKKY